MCLEFVGVGMNLGSYVSFTSLYLWLKLFGGRIQMLHLWQLNKACLRDKGVQLQRNAYECIQAEADVDGLMLSNQPKMEIKTNGNGKCAVHSGRGKTRTPR